MSSASLPELPAVSKVSQNVTRILGQNPGPYTLQGTNTMLASHTRNGKTSILLLDTGQGIPAYEPLLKSALDPLDNITQADVVLSHWHDDHVNGLPSVARAFKERGILARVWKFPCEEKDEEVEEKVQAAVDEVGEAFVAAGDGKWLHCLDEGQKLSLEEGFKEAPTFEVIHTPGHTTDSISLVMRPDNVLFTIDTVLGHGTAVFESLTNYMLSLTKLHTLLKKENMLILPGHGARIEDGEAKVREYYDHRMQREKQVRDVLHKNRGRSIAAEDIAQEIYGGTIPDTLMPAATRGVLLHLEKLWVHDGVVEHFDSDGEELITVVASNQASTDRDWVTNTWSDRWKLVDEPERSRI